MSTERVGSFPDLSTLQFLLGTARSLTDRQPEAAIATAQMAFERFVSFAFERMLRVRGVEPPLSERISEVVTPSLMDSATRRLWAELTGRQLKDAPDRAWRNYTEHVGRRNQMVHAGGRASPEEASASIDAVKALLNAMLEMARAAEAEVGTAEPHQRTYGHDKNSSESAAV